MLQLGTTSYSPCHLNTTTYHTIVIICLVRSTKTTDSDALRQQGLSEFWSVNAQRGAVPLHIPKPVYDQAEPTSSISPKTLDHKASKKSAVQQRWASLTYWARNEMLRIELRVWSDLLYCRTPTVRGKGVGFGLVSLQFVQSCLLPVANQAQG